MTASKVMRNNHTFGKVDDWHWTGPTPEVERWCARLGSARLGQRADALAKARA